MYQKDGPGILKRLYLDRIMASTHFIATKNLECKECKTILGIKIIYQKIGLHTGYSPVRSKRKLLRVLTS